MLSAVAPALRRRQSCAMSLVWSDWQSLAFAPTPNAITLGEIFDGGQAFRWHQQPDGAWRGIWAGHMAELRLAGSAVQWRAPQLLAAGVESALRDYFATDRDWTVLTDSLPWRSDAHLARCFETFPGLRILR